MPPSLQAESLYLTGRSQDADELTLPVPEDADELALIAYLDDELIPDEKEKLEQRLRNEPQLREKLSELNQTWDVLNFLDAQTTEPEKVCKTLQIIAQKTEAALQETTISPTLKTGKSVRKAILLAALLLFAAGVGFFSFNSFLNHYRQQKLDDLLLIERLDQYMLLDEKNEFGIDEVDFLKKLCKSKILE